MSRWTSEEFLGVFESVGDWSGMCIQTHEPPHTSLIEVSRVKNFGAGARESRPRRFIKSGTRRT